MSATLLTISATLLFSIQQVKQKCHSQVLKLQTTASLRAASSSKKGTKVKKSQNGQNQQSVKIYLQFQKNMIQNMVNIRDLKIEDQ